MSTPGMEGKAKVLCLHGFTQNAETFRAKTGSVRKHLKSKLEFVFVDAPHSAAGFYDQSDAASLGTTSDGVHENHAGPRAGWRMGADAYTHLTLPTILRVYIAGAADHIDETRAE